MSRVKSMWVAAIAAVTMSGLAAIGAPTASAVGPLEFLATLSGANEVPPVASTATGTASVTLSPDETEMTVNVIYSGLGSASTVAHIHKAPPGIGGPPIFPLTGPGGVNGGSFTLADAPVTPEQVADLRAGLWYVNIHSTGSPDGEIRGQLAAVAGSELTCHGKVVTKVGTNGPDTLVGTSARDVIAGLGGNDTISGLRGADVICGGAGDDVLRGGRAHDVLFGEDGDDSLFGGRGADGLIGGNGRDTGVGGRGRTVYSSIEVRR